MRNLFEWNFGKVRWSRNRCEYELRVNTKTQFGWHNIVLMTIEKGDDKIQHSGLGKNLMKEAEKISKEEFDAKKILVISAVGTREYYQKLGYSLYGPYMSKSLN